MDYAENGTLTKFINENKDKEHDWSFNTDLIKQITLGLTYVHHENIIHRDLKSLNILLAHGYQVKISDFGLSKTKNISSSYSKNNAVGTIAWMAPELLRDTNNPKYSEQSDIYALGMIVWEIAAKCTTPFKEVDNNLVGLHILRGGREVIPNDIPENIQGIIQKCWEYNPNERITLTNLLKIIRDARLGYQDANNKYPSDHHVVEQYSLLIQNPKGNEQALCSTRDLNLNINNFNLDELNIQEKNSAQNQIEISPK